MVNVKKRVLGHLNGITSRLMYIPRRMYHKQKAKRCNTEKCCIICNNCTGGMILHDLGLRFDSPTINTLFFSADDFLFLLIISSRSLNVKSSKFVIRDIHIL